MSALLNIYLMSFLSEKGRGESCSVIADSSVESGLTARLLRLTKGKNPTRWKPLLGHNSTKNIFLRVVPFRGGWNRSNTSIQPFPKHPYLSDSRQNTALSKWLEATVNWLGLRLSVRSRDFWLGIPIVDSKLGVVCIFTLVNLHSSWLPSRRTLRRSHANSIEGVFGLWWWCVGVRGGVVR